MFLSNRLAIYFTCRRVGTCLWLMIACAVFASGAHADQSTMTEPIKGSTDRTAQQGYSQAETIEHLSNFDHSRWDVTDDETKRFLHLNGPQAFTHAWVHRAGPISVLETNEQKQLGSVKANTLVGEISLDQWIADGTVDGFLVLHRGQIVFEQYPRMRPFDQP